MGRFRSILLVLKCSSANTYYPVLDSSKQMLLRTAHCFLKTCVGDSSDDNSVGGKITVHLVRLVLKRPKRHQQIRGTP